MMNIIRRSVYYQTIRYNSTTIKELCKVNSPDKAAKEYRRMKEEGETPDLEAFNSLISLFGRFNRPDRSEVYFNDLEKHYKPTHLSYQYLLESLGKHQSPLHLRSIMDSMRKYDLSPNINVYNALLDSCTKESHLPLAEQFIAEITAQGIKLNAYTYNKLIELFGTCKQLERALSIFEDMKSNSIEPNPFTYCNIIEACGINHNYEKAIDIWKEMKENNVRLTSDIYTSIIDMCLNCGKIES